MSMHKAVVLRSAHRTMMARQMEQMEEEEVAGSVIPVLEQEEEEAARSDGPAAETAGTTGIIGAGVNLFSSVARFVRKSLSPERKPMGSNQMDIGHEEGEIVEEDDAMEGVESTLTTVTPEVRNFDCGITFIE